MGTAPKQTKTGRGEKCDDSLSDLSRQGPLNTAPPFQSLAGSSPKPKQTYYGLKTFDKHDKDTSPVPKVA